MRVKSRAAPMEVRARVNIVCGGVTAAGYPASWHVAVSIALCCLFYFSLILLFL